MSNLISRERMYIHIALCKHHKDLFPAFIVEYADVWIKDLLFTTYGLFDIGWLMYMIGNNR